MRQTVHLQGEALILSLAGLQPKISLPVCTPKIFLTPTENQADRQECTTVKMTHSSDFNNTDKRAKRFGHKHDFYFVQLKMSNGKCEK